MSNFLAIATVTATLQRLLQASVQMDVDGARVTTVRPDGLGSGTPETGINLYLYQVKPLNWRNADLPTRRQEHFVKRPSLAIDLSYLLSFYGNDSELEPQRLMGSTLRTLHSRPILGREIIRETIESGNLNFLADSNLPDQLDVIQIAPLPLNTDELSKIWSVFFQTPYALSFAYQISAVMLESDDIPQRALPVQEMAVLLMTPDQPKIDQVLSQDELRKSWRSTQDQPVLATSTICLRGKRIKGNSTCVRVGAVDLPLQTTDDDKAIVDLNSAPPGTLRAGVQSIQLLNVKEENGKSQRIIASNIVALVLRPIVVAVGYDRLELIDGLRKADIILTINPTVGKLQKIELVLNERTTQSPTAYSFTAAPRQEDNHRVIVPIYEVKSGTYLVRVLVDGAESLLSIDNGRDSTTFHQYVGPLLTLP